MSKQKIDNKLATSHDKQYNYHQILLKSQERSQNWENLGNTLTIEKLCNTQWSTKVWNGKNRNYLETLASFSYVEYLILCVMQIEVITGFHISISG